MSRVFPQHCCHAVYKFGGFQVTEARILTWKSSEVAFGLCFLPDPILLHLGFELLFQPLFYARVLSRRTRLF